MLASLGSNTVVTLGNITGNYFIGNGSLLTGLASSAYGNANVSTYLSQYDGSINFTSSTGGIANVDTITVLDFIRSDSYQFSNGVSILSTVYGNANVASYLLTYTGNISANNISAGNVTTTGNVDASFVRVSSGIVPSLAVSPAPIISGFSSISTTGTPGNITASGNLIASQDARITGNVTAGNLNVTGNIVDTGALSIITGSNGNIALIPDGTGIVTVSNALIVAGNITGNTSGFAIGYRDIPQVVFTSNATLALSDAGKHYFSSNSANVITVPNNATVSFSIGTAISIVQQGTANLTVTPGSGVTMYLAGNSTSASRTVGNYGMATLMKVNTDTWFINGTGVN